MRLRAIALTFITTSLMGGCQTVEGQSINMSAAKLDSQQDMDILMTTLKEVMKDRSANLGVGDPLTESRFTVLPKKLSSYERRAAVMPTSFEIITDGERCFIRKGSVESGETYALPEASCSKL